MCMTKYLQTMGTEGERNGSGRWLPRQQSGLQVTQKTSATLLQNNPCICELKVLKIKGKFIILLDLTFFKIEQA